MNEIGDAFCPNKECKDYGLQNHGNITIRGKYGKDKTKDLLYCRTCGQRFASTRATAFFGLHLSDEKIEQIIHNFAPYNPRTIKKLNGYGSPAERLNQFRYHDNWLHNLYISASLGGYRSPPQNPV